MTVNSATTHSDREPSRTDEAHLLTSVRSRAFIVIPAYNESRSIEKVVRELRAVYPNIVVIDDGSCDATGACAARAGATVLRHVINRGQGAALQTGIEYSLAQGADFLVTFDSDGQHCMEDLPALLAPILRGEAEIALGSRFLGRVENMPWTRWLLLKGAVWFTRLTSGMRLTDAHNGLRAFSRRAAQQIHITLDRMAHASEIIDQIRASQLAVREVPVTIRYTEYSRAKGQSSLAAVKVAIHYLLGKVLR